MGQSFLISGNWAISRIQLSPSCPSGYLTATLTTATVPSSHTSLAN